MRNVSDNTCRENRNTHFMFSNFFLNGGFYDVMWKNRVEPERPKTIIWCLRISCYVTKATNTHVIVLAYLFKVFFLTD